MKPETWWQPRIHADRRPGLIARNRAKAALRAWFEAEDFVEVEGAALQVSPGNETHLHAFATRLRGMDGSASALYLHTSPEFALKKLLAAGETKIFDFARVFRNRERSALHAPEFTMLEWYRAGEGYEALMGDCGTILRCAAAATGSQTLRHRGREADPYAEPERLSVAEAFEREAGINLLATLTAGGEPDREALAEAASLRDIRVAPDDSWSDIFSRVMAERIEPAIGNGRATLLCDYPLPEAALARPKASDPRLAERFELFACGVELANAFGELRDPAEQRRRFEADMAAKEKLYGERYPIDEAFLAALPLMPDASGSALGFDRLVMLLLGAGSVEAVQWTPVVGAD